MEIYGFTSKQEVEACLDHLRDSYELPEPGEIKNLIIDLGTKIEGDKELSNMVAEAFVGFRAGYAAGRSHGTG